MEDIDEFSGFSKLSVAKFEQKSQILSELIRNLENEIQETEKSAGGYLILILETWNVANIFISPTFDLTAFAS